MVRAGVSLTDCVYGMKCMIYSCDFIQSCQQADFWIARIGMHCSERGLFVKSFNPEVCDA